jgi:hypothetical protein
VGPDRPVSRLLHTAAPHFRRAGARLERRSMARRIGRHRAVRERAANQYDRRMLKGSREVILRKVQPLAVHGQISWDIFFSDVEDPDGPVTVARVGPESISHRIEPGDRLRLEYVLGAVIGITRVAG